jgi:hypothetical protein
LANIDVNYRQLTGWNHESRLISVVTRNQTCSLYNLWLQTLFKKKHKNAYKNIFFQQKKIEKLKNEK